MAVYHAKQKYNYYKPILVFDDLIDVYCNLTMLEETPFSTSNIKKIHNSFLSNKYLYNVPLNHVIFNKTNNILQGRLAYYYII